MSIIFKKFTKHQAIKTAQDIEKWFAKHLKRRVCRTNLFTVRRNHVKEDVAKHSVKGAFD